MAAADIYAMPSLEEPFGMVYAEAQAMKKPVIALNAGGAPEVIAHGITGLLSKPYDTEQLAANILALLRQPELRKQLGEAGRKHVEEQFSVQLMANKVEDIYRSVLHKPLLTPELINGTVTS